MKNLVLAVSLFLSTAVPALVPALASAQDCTGGGRAAVVVNAPPRGPRFAPPPRMDRGRFERHERFHHERDGRDARRGGHERRFGR